MVFFTNGLPKDLNQVCFRVHISFEVDLEDPDLLRPVIHIEPSQKMSVRMGNLGTLSHFCVMKSENSEQKLCEESIFLVYNSKTIDRYNYEKNEV